MAKQDDVSDLKEGVGFGGISFNIGIQSKCFWGLFEEVGFMDNVEVLYDII